MGMAADLGVPGNVDIRGMSGGPLLGMKVGEQTSYKPIGVQSGWLRESTIAAICPLEAFAAWVQSRVAEVIGQIESVA